MPIIEFVEVQKTYGRPGEVAPALEGVSLAVEEGEFALLMGPSGAGKSTLLKLLLAMERPEQGTICVAGRDVHRLTRGSVPFLRRNVGAVFQDFKLLPEASPMENVALTLQVLGLRPREVRRRAGAALEAVRLDPGTRKPVRSMSGGEQQRVALARALAGEPPILLADEPTGNLDPDLTREILAQLVEIQSRGTTVLLATHDPLVRECVDATRFLYLEQGHLVDDVVTPHLRAVTGPDEEATPHATPSTDEPTGDLETLEAAAVSEGAA